MPVIFLLIKVSFLQNKRFQDFIISGETINNQRKYLYVSFWLNITALELGKVYTLNIIKSTLKIMKLTLEIMTFTLKIICPVSWGCRIHWLHLCRGVRPRPNECPDMTLNNLMVRFQQRWSFGECGVPLHCHRSHVHSGPAW